MNDGFVHGSAAQIGAQMEALLSMGQYVTLKITGDSMRPTLKPGRDAVVLGPMGAWPPKRGDILFYRTQRSEGGYAVHRVRRVTPQGVIMNGDAQQWVDGPIAQGDVLAQAVTLLRAGKPVDIEKKSYRLYVGAWYCTRPFRRPMFALWRGIKRIVTGK